MLRKTILNSIEHTPTKEQSECINALCTFSTTPVDHKAFLLKGYAGTGKTTIISAYINALKTLGHGVILMAPTGRAAKVLANYSNTSATSIHKAIYRQQGAGSSSFSLNHNKHKNTIFIIDEASMIANLGTSDTHFGSGRLLDDLIEYVYTGDNCQMIVLGDDAQLKPVGENYSPALEKPKLESYGLEVFDYQLTDVVRQANESGILHNATILRHSIFNSSVTPKFNTDFPDIERVSGEDLIDKINHSYDYTGIENTAIITYSNKRSVLYNRGVRNQVLQKEDEISNGDFLVITKNNYFWSKQYDNLDFIANGESAEIIRIRKHYDIYNLRFADVTLRLIDRDIEIDTKILIDSLYTETQATINTLNNKLLEEIAEDYPEITTKKELWKELRKNEFFNALQIKFSYAITCHKAQGGQWDHVFIDQGYLPDDAINESYYQWLYTAFTRARHKLFLVNFSERFF